MDAHYMPLDSAAFHHIFGSYSHLWNKLFYSYVANKQRSEKTNKEMNKQKEINQSNKKQNKTKQLIHSVA
jgi:sterol desaturase/sphingolipid hydroxylase (fatty acid hydroxylase superfamily)